MKVIWEQCGVLIRFLATDYLTMTVFGIAHHHVPAVPAFGFVEIFMMVAAAVSLKLLFQTYRGASK